MSLHKLSFDRANFIPGFACLAAHVRAQRNVIIYRRPMVDSSGQFLAIWNTLEILVNFDASKLFFEEAAETTQFAQSSQREAGTEIRSHPPTFDVARPKILT